MSFVSKLFPPYDWQIKLIATATLCVAFFIAGWVTHGWKKDAAVTHTIAKQEKTRESDEKLQGDIVKDQQEQQVIVRTVYKTIREKIYDQNDQSVCFTAESLSMWNSAIGANTDLYRRKPAGETETTDTAQGDQEGNPGEDIIATVEDTLINATDNFETCTDNSVKHLALIERVRSLQGNMCYCSK